MTTRPMKAFHDTARAALAAALHQMGVKDMENALNALNVAPGGKGDFTFPAFVLSRELKHGNEKVDIPKVVSELMASIPAKEPFERLEAAGPYLNFHLRTEPLVRSTLDAILEEKTLYGTEPDKGTRVILEHTSANPNGPFHVGRARNPIIGDTMARILRGAGFDVETQYYVNDMGKQVALLVWGMEKFRPEELPRAEKDKPDHDAVRYYQKASGMLATDKSVDDAVNQLLLSYEGGNEETGEKFRSASQRVLDGMRASLARINVNIDHYVWESQFVEDGSSRAVVESLRKAPCAGTEDGAHFLDLKEFGIHGKETRFFFTRRDGTTLYTTRDVAYHLYKLAHCDIAINILGEDHKLEAKQLSVALKLIGSTKLPETVFYSFVSLPEGKMSTRQNRVVCLDDLIDEAVERAYVEVHTRRTDLGEEQMRRIAELVGVGALRYNVIRVQPEKQIVFKWEEALNFEGNAAPFIQYSHARCCSILQKAGAYGSWTEEQLTAPQEAVLARTLARFPETIIEAANQRRPHIVAAFAHETAAALNQFYKACPVIKAETAELRESRLALVDASRWVLRNALTFLGIAAPDEM